MFCVFVVMCYCVGFGFFCFSSIRRHTRCALVTGVQTCALPISSLAEAIVAHRDQAGAFKTRRELLEVSRLGPKTFEQCAGFLRISGGGEPLDASSVHPEAYGLAAKIGAACGRALRTPPSCRASCRERRLQYV